MESQASQPAATVEISFPIDTRVAVVECFDEAGQPVATPKTIRITPCFASADGRGTVGYLDIATRIKEENKVISSGVLMLGGNSGKITVNEYKKVVPGFVTQ